MCGIAELVWDHSIFIEMKVKGAKMSWPEDEAAID
jgi:hypothetical protein